MKILHWLGNLTSFGRRQPTAPPIPPPALRAGIGEGEFQQIADEFLEIFKTVAKLEPDESVLDCGCGVGRMARPLLGYLKEGSYEGFDIMAPAIDWCQKNLAPLHPRFSFKHVDVKNRMYNPNGSIAPESFRFPYGDDQFDFVFLTSVFTHMFAAEVHNYLAEIRRVLRPRGRVLATFFIVDQEAVELIAQGRSSIGFHHPWSDGWYADPDNPEAAVGYTPEAVSAAFSAAGLHIEAIHLGNWCERKHTLSYQDIVLARNPGEP